MSGISVGISVRYIDRPAAEFFELHFRLTVFWTLLEHLLAPLKLVVIAALLFMFSAGGWVLSGRRLGGWADKPLIFSWTVIWALAAEFVFKQIFGRGWPDPTYIKNHLYGFRFLQASDHWSSFPSGTAISSAALAVVVWLVTPRLRVPGLLLAVIVCSAVIVTNDHWVSDVIAGAFLGASIGWMSVLLIGSDRVEQGGI